MCTLYIDAELTPQAAQESMGDVAMANGLCVDGARLATQKRVPRMPPIRVDDACETTIYYVVVDARAVCGCVVYVQLYPFHSCRGLSRKALHTSEHRVACVGKHVGITPTAISSLRRSHYTCACTAYACVHVHTSQKAGCTIARYLSVDVSRGLDDAQYCVVHNLPPQRVRDILPPRFFHIRKM